MQQQAVGRGSVFGQVLWRSLAVATIGGALIGALVALAFLPFDDGVVAADVGWFAYAGAFFGLLLGVLAGLMIAGVAAATLVPFRSAEKCRKTVRWAATLCVIGYLGLWTVPAWDEPVVVAVVIVSVIGAAATSGFLINWYIRRATPALTPD